MRPRETARDPGPDTAPSLQQPCSARGDLLEAGAQARHVGGKQSELPLRDANHRHRIEAANRGVAWRALEERHLPEALPGTQRRQELVDKIGPLAPAPHDFSAPREQDVDPVTKLPFVED